MSEKSKQPEIECNELTPFSDPADIARRTMTDDRREADDWEMHFDNLDGGFVNGWAWIRSLPNTAVKVEVSLNPNKRKLGVANAFRKDLLDAEIGNGVHGFRIDVREWDLSGAAITLCQPGRRNEAGAITISTSTFGTLLRQDWFLKFLDVLEPALATHLAADADLLPR